MKELMITINEVELNKLLLEVAVNCGCQNNVGEKIYDEWLKFVKACDTKERFEEEFKKLIRCGHAYDILEDCLN